MKKFQMQDFHIKSNINSTIFETLYFTLVPDQFYADLSKKIKMSLDFSVNSNEFLSVIESVLKNDVIMSAL